MEQKKSNQTTNEQPRDLRVLIVEDDPDDLFLAIKALKKGSEDLTVIKATTRNELDKSLREGGFNLVITDYDLKWSNGLKVLQEVKARYAHCPVIMLTGTGTEEIATTGMKSGLNDYLTKTRENYMRLPMVVASALKMNRGREQLNKTENDLRVKAQLAHIFLMKSDHEMYAEVLEVVLHHLKSSHGIFGYLDQKGDLVVPSMMGYVWKECRVQGKATVFPHQSWKEGIWPTSIRQKKPICTNSPPEGLPEGHVPIKRVVSFPIMFRGEPIGLFQVANKENDYDENDMALLKSISEYVAPILQARLERDMKEEERKQEETQRIEANALYLQSQKMEALGTLSGGIAHDFNNILGIILGNTELIMGDVPQGNPARESLDEIHGACLRAKNLVHQILGFSRKSDVQQEPLHMAPVVAESLKLLRASIPTSVDIRPHISNHVDHILGDATQIHQIMMNLCTNGAHAMADEGGTLEVTLENRMIDEEAASPYPELAPGPHVLLRVSDTGDGIDPEIIDRVFDPYFTTKELGKGTGLGLSVVHGIVNSHHGKIFLESRKGVGTTFRVLFPAVPEGIREKPKVFRQMPTGNERILVVDDETSLVELNRRLFEGLGYEVIAKCDPSEALAFFRADPDQIDLVVTDMTMPRMTGDKLARKILEIKPDMPIILATGYSDKVSDKSARELGIRKYIQKPMQLEDLAISAREVLDGQ